jgi:hypothetical protein
MKLPNKVRSYHVSMLICGGLIINTWGIHHSAIFNLDFIGLSNSSPTTQR